LFRRSDGAPMDALVFQVLVRSEYQFPQGYVSIMDFGRKTYHALLSAFLSMLPFVSMFDVCWRGPASDERGIFTCICHVLCGCICPRTRHKGHRTHLLTICIFTVTSPARVAQGTLPWSW